MSKQTLPIIHIIGLPEDGPGITKAVMEAQYKEIDEKSGEKSSTFGIDLDRLAS